MADENILVDRESCEAKQTDLIQEDNTNEGAECPEEMSMFASVLPNTNSLYLRNLRDIENSTVFSIRNNKVNIYTTESKSWKPVAPAGRYHSRVVIIPG